MTSGESDTIISLVTCYPGSDIYELEGHTAVRIRTSGSDVAVNYGMFDFDAPNFVYRFVKGETDYGTAAYDFRLFLYGYQREGRKVVEQTLDLAPHEKAKLIELVKVNLRPENSTYRYNYVKDNCATRPLALIEASLSDTISFSPSVDSTLRWNTFREAMREYHANYPWYQFGIDLALGSGIDYRMSMREKSFAPVALEKMLSDSKVGERKLVASTDTLYEGRSDGGPEGATPAMLTPIAVSVAIFLLACVVSGVDISKRRISKWFDCIWFGLTGVVGCVLTFLIFVSVHEATSPNWLYMWLNPLGLTVPVFGLLKSCKKLIISYHLLNFVLLSAMIVIWWWLPQSGNIAFVPLIGVSYIRSMVNIYLYYVGKR